MKYILKDDAPDGVFDGIGEVRHGQVIEPAYPEQEEALKASTFFKQHRGPAPAESGEPVTDSATVEDAEAPAPAKAKGKEK